MTIKRWTPDPAEVFADFEEDAEGEWCKWDDVAEELMALDVDYHHRIARALKILAEPLPADSPLAQLASDVRRALGAE